MPNAYVLGPALLPTIGSPNPMLTCTALARSLGDHLTTRIPPVPDPGFHLLFDGVTADGWRMSTIKNQPARHNPGRFIAVDGALEAVPDSDIGHYWHTDATPADFILKLEWLRWSDDDNSGVFLTQALERTEARPAIATTDKASIYPPTVATLPLNVSHRTGKWSNGQSSWTTSISKGDHGACVASGQCPLLRCSARDMP